jgi:hypothetical protein
MQRYTDFAKSFFLPLPEMDISSALNDLVTRNLSEPPGMDKAAFRSPEILQQWSKYANVVKHTPPLTEW